LLFPLSVDTWPSAVAPVSRHARPRGRLRLKQTLFLLLAGGGCHTASMADDSSSRRSGSSPRGLHADALRRLLLRAFLLRSGHVEDDRGQKIVLRRRSAASAAIR